MEPCPYCGCQLHGEVCKYCGYDAFDDEVIYDDDDDSELDEYVECYEEDGNFYIDEMY